MQACIPAAGSNIRESAAPSSTRLSVRRDLGGEAALLCCDWRVSPARCQQHVWPSCAWKRTTFLVMDRVATERVRHRRLDVGRSQYHACLVTIGQKTDGSLCTSSPCPHDSAVEPYLGDWFAGPKRDCPAAIANWSRHLSTLSPCCLTPTLF